MRARQEKRDGRLSEDECKRRGNKNFKKKVWHSENGEGLKCWKEERKREKDKERYDTKFRPTRGEYGMGR